MLIDCAASGDPMAAGPPSPSASSRRLTLVELILCSLLLLLVSGLQPALGRNVYTNTWAVHIPGGREEAEQIASKHGFINYGHVSLPFLLSSVHVVVCVVVHEKGKNTKWHEVVFRHLLNYHAVASYTIKWNQR